MAGELLGQRLGCGFHEHGEPLSKDGGKDGGRQPTRVCAAFSINTVKELTP
jgi:hypothetical protein